MEEIKKQKTKTADILKILLLLLSWVELAWTQRI